MYIHTYSVLEIGKMLTLDHLMAAGYDWIRSKL